MDTLILKPKVLTDSTIIFDIDRPRADLSLDSSSYLKWTIRWTAGAPWTTIQQFQNYGQLIDYGGGGGVQHSMYGTSSTAEATFLRGGHWIYRIIRQLNVTIGGYERWETYPRDVSDIEDRMMISETEMENNHLHYEIGTRILPRRGIAYEVDANWIFQYGDERRVALSADSDALELYNRTRAINPAAGAIPVVEMANMIGTHNTSNYKDYRAEIDCNAKYRYLKLRNYCRHMQVKAPGVGVPAQQYPLDFVDIEIISRIPAWPFSYNDINRTLLDYDRIRVEMLIEPIFNNIFHSTGAVAVAERGTLSVIECDLHAIYYQTHASLMSNTINTLAWRYYRRVFDLGVFTDVLAAESYFTGEKSVEYNLSYPLKRIVITAQGTGLKETQPSWTPLELTEVNMVVDGRTVLDRYTTPMQYKTYRETCLHKQVMEYDEWRKYNCVCILENPYLLELCRSGSRVMLHIKWRCHYGKFSGRRLEYIDPNLVIDDVPFVIQLLEFY